MKKAFLLFSFFTFSIIAIAQKNKSENILHSFFLDSLLMTDDSLNTFLKNKTQNNIQIIYTKIDRDTANFPTFTKYYFNVNHQNYFYPASTVKMPLAFLSLEKLNDLKKYNLTKESIFITDSSAPKQEIVFNDPSNENGCPTIAHYIKKVFLVSNNDAYNRLYEFLGQGYIQKKLKQKGYHDVAIRHRFQTALNEEDNKHTNEVRFFDTAGNLLYKQNAQYSKASFKSAKVLLGNAHYMGNSLVNQPFDFTLKNKIYLNDLHEILKSVYFPEAMTEEKKFNLTNEDYQFIYKWMSAYPKESKYPYYDTSIYYDAYVKYFMFGSEKETIPNNIRIFDKVGLAYGFLTDVAYIIDTTNKVEFLLSATISCNSDGVYNDDKYDYKTVGFPFFKKLGNVIYKYELNRTRNHSPDLSKFIINYSN